MGCGSSTTRLGIISQESSTSFGDAGHAHKFSNHKHARTTQAPRNSLNGNRTVIEVPPEVPFDSKSCTSSNHSSLQNTLTRKNSPMRSSDQPSSLPNTHEVIYSLDSQTKTRGKQCNSSDCQLPLDNNNNSPSVLSDKPLSCRFENNDNIWASLGRPRRISRGHRDAACVTFQELKSMRDAFWKTAPEYGGDPNIWHSLRAICECDDPELAAAILHSSGVVIPSGATFDKGVYDDKGTIYVVPQYCWNQPENYIGSGTLSDHNQPLAHDQTCSVATDHDCTAPLHGEPRYALRDTHDQLGLQQAAVGGPGQYADDETLQAHGPVPTNQDLTSDHTLLITVKLRIIDASGSEDIKCSVSPSSDSVKTVKDRLLQSMNSRSSTSTASMRNAELAAAAPASGQGLYSTSTDSHDLYLQRRDRVRFIYGGQVLAENTLLDDYDIKNGHVIQVMIS
eukprot:Nk52_evm10s244 gene=Nk52_evmTU10s244